MRHTTASSLLDLLRRKSCFRILAGGLTWTWDTCQHLDWWICQDMRQFAVDLPRRKIRKNHLGWWICFDVRHERSSCLIDLPRRETDETWQVDLPRSEILYKILLDGSLKTRDTWNILSGGSIKMSDTLYYLAWWIYQDISHEAPSWLKELRLCIVPGVTKLSFHRSFAWPLTGPLLPTIC